MSNFNICPSSLLSLQAELTRKKQEVNDIKKGKVAADKSPYSVNHKTVICVEKLQRERKLKVKTKEMEVISSEEENLLNKSKSMLEAKSALYDKLQRGHLVFDEGCGPSLLIDFEEKRKYEGKEDSETEEYGDYYSEDEWVDYVDSLGRTRRCLQKDLDHYKSRDKELFKRNDPQEQSVKDAIEKAKERSEEMRLIDEQREEMRKKWEAEMETLSKKKDIHYQDVLFDEARMHGTAYYHFSQDEKERRSQQESLANIRKDVAQEREVAEAIKKKREARMKARLDAARRRKRIAQGLPPDEESDKEGEKNGKEEKRGNQKEQDEKNESEDLSCKIKENLDKIRRATHLRPWDLGKDGIKEPRPVLTQQEWVSRKRTERIAEFAPLPDYKMELEPAEEMSNLLCFSSASSKRQKRRKGSEIPPPPSYDENASVKFRKTSSIAECVEIGLNVINNKSAK